MHLHLIAAPRGPEPRRESMGAGACASVPNTAKAATEDSNPETDHPSPNHAVVEVPCADAQTQTSVSLLSHSLLAISDGTHIPDDPCEGSTQCFYIGDEDSLEESAEYADGTSQTTTSLINLVICDDELQWPFFSLPRPPEDSFANKPLECSELPRPPELCEAEHDPLGDGPPRSLALDVVDTCEVETARLIGTFALPREQIFGAMQYVPCELLKPPEPMPKVGAEVPGDHDPLGDGDELPRSLELDVNEESVHARACAGPGILFGTLPRPPEGGKGVIVEPPDYTGKTGKGGKGVIVESPDYTGKGGKGGKGVIVEPPDYTGKGGKGGKRVIVEPPRRSSAIGVALM